MRIRDPKTTALIFANGKIVCTGAKSEADSKTAALAYAKQLRKISNKEVKLTDFKIQNITATVDVGFPVKIETLLRNSMESGANCCQYEPELFPGRLVFRIFKPKVDLLIFASGKIVLAGAKTRVDIHEAYQKIKYLLKAHRNLHSSKL